MIKEHYVQDCTNFKRIALFKALKRPEIFSAKTMIFGFSDPNIRKTLLHNVPKGLGEVLHVTLFWVYVSRRQYLIFLGGIYFSSTFSRGWGLYRLSTPV